MVEEDSEIFSSPEKNASFGTLEKGSLVKILQEEENGFVFVEYNGDNFYIETCNLSEI